ncbi:tyrosine-type recombinase/integrase [Amycolatopsis keratiniphila]|uniref:tyrosine-type recombinase/integrase n=1 Tax=Amycolatopsis keratiniphila TaxID=129921 RepID=UPI001E59C944|nr:tyrosine-type recombinase/integrase [Amycolatopsis keratiniphila]
MSNALDYAVDLRLIDKNPLPDVNWTAMPKGKRKVDKRAVPNPIQTRSILAVVRVTPRSGERFHAYFGSMYFCGLRPEEATALNKRHLDLPEPERNPSAGELEFGWGELHLDMAEPYIDARWTNGGTAHDPRHLKSRGAGEGRTVPCPPEQTQLFHEHIQRFGYGDDGRVFVGEQGDSISKVTYGKLWRTARAVALTPEAQASPLAARPYDLRQAYVSTLLAAGVDPAVVAEWAGHSLAVLMEIYATWLYGAEVTARQLVQKALGH